MKFLCLHGIGTNSDVLEIQTAPLRYMITGDHEYEFVDGALLAPGPAAHIEEFYGKHEEYYLYYDHASADSILSAINDLSNFFHSDGPFDAIIAFSQGAALAATLMIAQERGIAIGDQPLPSIKFAVLLSSTVPFDVVQLQQGQVEFADRDSRSETGRNPVPLIKTPTAHFWDVNDPEYPGFSQRTASLCDLATRVEVHHSGGHGIPAASKQEELQKMASAVQLLIEQYQ